MSDELLHSAREAFARRDWAAARDLYVAAREQSALNADDLFAWSDAAWWLGSMREMLDIATESFEAYEKADRRREAARLAMEIGIAMLMRGDEAVGSGWLARSRRLIGDDDCAERGYLMFIEMQGALAGGDFEGAGAAARAMQECGARFDDATLTALGRFSEGQMLVKAGRMRDGMDRIDETMLSVTSGRVAPAFAGNIYCGMIALCTELGDIRRARQWTAATEQWCATFPAAVMFLGICRMHRAQLDVMAGEWARAHGEAEQVVADLAEMNAEAVAEAHYQIGEIRRLRGDAAGAEDAYATAHALGRDPQPGLALLRLSQGKTEAARGSIAAAVAAAPDRVARAALLPAQVTILIAAGDAAGANAAAADLEEIAALYATPGFEAAARTARGEVTMAAGDAAAALPALRDARSRWLAADARYQAARVGLLLARALDAVGDGDGARMERAAAESLLGSIGAETAAAALPAGLSEREAEVLRHVAAGATNKQIAAAMFIADKTVARHLSNIFTKIGVTSRTAAAAFAFEHGLAAPRGDG